MPDTGEVVEEEVPSYQRPRGVLTSDDRAYLLGQKDLGDQAERDTRYRIRERVKNALWDFNLLSEFQERRDREKIFEVFEDEPEFLADVLTYVFCGLYDQVGEVNEATEQFEWLLSNALRNAISDEKHLVEDVTVDISIEVRQPEVEELLEKIENSEASPAETLFLFRSGELTPDEQRKVSRHMFEMLRDGTLSIEVAQVDEDGRERRKELGPDDAQAVLDRFDEEKEGE